MTAFGLRVLCLFAVTLSITADLLAQHDFDRPSKVIRAENGLPNHYLRGFDIDANGFAWIGSYEGLVRFDGHHLQTYQSKAEDTTSILSNTVASVAAHPHNGEVWVGTFKGLSVYDPRTNGFRNYQKSEVDSNSLLNNFINWVHVDRTGDSWVASGSDVLCLYDREKDSFKRFYPRTSLDQQSGETKGSASDVIQTIELDPHNDSLLWIGSRFRFFTFNKVTEEFDYNYPDLEGLNQIFPIDGQLYLHGGGSQIRVFDPKLRKVVNTITLPKGWNVSWIFRRSDGLLYLSCGKGIAVLNPQDGSLSYPWLNDPSQSRKYQIDHIDKQNRAWSVSTLGVRVYDTLTTQFQNFFFEENLEPRPLITQFIIESPDSQYIYLNVSQGDGVYRYDQETKEWLLIPPPPNFGKSSFRGTDLAYTSDGELLILEYSNVYTLSPDGTKMVLHPISESLPENAGWNNFFVDSQSRVWLGSRTLGIVRADLKTNESTNLYDEFSPCKRARFRFDFYEDRNQNIWLSNCGGFSVWLKESDSFLHFLMGEGEEPENTFEMIDQFAPDSKGFLWVSSKLDGKLGKIDPAQPEKGIIYKMDPIAAVRAGEIKVTKGVFQDFSGFSRLVIDPDDKFWSLASEGLFKYDPDEQTIELYNDLEGLQWLDEELKVVTVNRIINLKSGKMAVAFRKGFSVFDPRSLQGSKEQPKPYLTSFKVYNNELQTDSSLLHLKRIELDPWQNYFSFDFSAIGYTHPEKYQYRYQLEGVDEEWIYSGQRNYAAYTNVRGGEYTFKVAVANNDGYWSPDPLTIRVFVGTPWYQQLWFKLLAALLVIGGAFSFYRYRLQQVKLKGEYEKKVGDMELTALRAQMNPHFIFNSLNSIENYIIQNETVKASEYLNGFSRLMRLILQNSRTHLVNLRDEIEALKLYMDMESLRFNNEVEYKVNIDEALDPDEIDIPPMLIQPYIENGIWHGLRHKGGPGKITLSFAKDNGYLKCTIEDNGVGRSKAASMGNQNPRRKSMAMNITNERLQTINKIYETDASVHIEDLVDEKGEAAGTRVELSISY